MYRFVVIACAALTFIAIGCAPKPGGEAWLCPIEGGRCPDDCAPLEAAPLNHAQMCLEDAVLVTCLGGDWTGTGISTCVEDADGTQYIIGFGNPIFYEMGYAYCELPPWAFSATRCP